MIFRSRNKILDPGNDIFINGCKIEQVQTTKFLGVIIDCNLTWKYHISYVCSKISKNIGILIKSRKVFDTNTLLTLYYSFIYPYLNYCVHLWGSTYDTYVNKIFLLQKKAMRIILGVNQRAHSEPLFSSLCVLSVSNVYMYNIGLLMYKYHHGLLPNILDMFELNSTIHQYYTRQSNLLHVPSCRTELGKRFFLGTKLSLYGMKFIKMFVLISKLVHLSDTWNLIYLTTQFRLKVMFIITGAAHGLALKKCQSVGCTRDICIDDRN